MKTILIFLFCLFLTGYGDIKNTSIVYKAAGNSVGDVELKIYDDNSFELKLMYFKEVGKYKRKFKGEYFLSDSIIKLKFNEKKLILPNLFIEQYDDNNGFVLINNTDVEIKRKKEYIYIYGIRCEKVK